MNPIATGLAIASGHRPRVFRRLLAIWYVTRPIELELFSAPHPREPVTLKHYLTVKVDPNVKVDAPFTFFRNSP